MKFKNLLFLFTSLLVLNSCDDNTDVEYYDVATPILMTADEMRSSVKISPPKDIIESGKIYAYNDLVFVNDKNKGVHIIDNADPRNPYKKAYIEIPGNVDISVKDDYLYANSFVDLLVFDISNLNEIKEISRLIEVFPIHIDVPEGADAIDWNYAYGSGSFVIGWEIERRPKPEQGDIIYETMMDAASNVGTGGSLARFKIVEDYLYAVDSHNINVFDIANLEEPTKLESVFAGFDIETIFNKDQYLYLGSMSGMYIYDISMPEAPQFVSEFQHGTACDPVVVDETFAYITLRAGNSCGAFDSSLQIVDITDVRNPVLEVSYPMDNPYGLGIKDGLLFICDGNSGLKVYDKYDVNDLKLVSHFENITTYDVIPLQDHLLMIGDEVLYQYSYVDYNLTKLSEFRLN